MQLHRVSPVSALCWFLKDAVELTLVIVVLLVIQKLLDLGTQFTILLRELDHGVLQLI